MINSLTPFLPSLALHCCASHITAECSEVFSAQPSLDTLHTRSFSPLQCADLLLHVHTHLSAFLRKFVLVSGANQSQSGMKE